MSFTTKEKNYLNKLLNSGSDLDPEVILDVINRKREENKKIDISLLIEYIESYNEEIDSSSSKNSPASKKSLSKQKRKMKDAKDLLVFEKIFSELEPRLKNLLIPPIPLQYTILSGKTQAVLSAEVNQYIRMGWQPIGAVGAAAFGLSPVGGNQYIQAMVKY